MKNFFPYTIFLPFSESCIDTLPWSIAFWHFSPLSSCSCNPQHSIQHDAVIFCRSSSFACSLCWQLVFDSFPFAIADFISFHSSILSFFGSFVQVLFFYFSNKAPNCSFVSPMHALLPEERNLKQRPDGSYYDLEYGKPITVGSNCWFGSNVTVGGGVTIGGAA